MDYSYKHQAVPNPKVDRYDEDLITVGKITRRVYNYPPNPTIEKILGALPLGRILNPDLPLDLWSPEDLHIALLAFLFYTHKDFLLYWPRLDSPTRWEKVIGTIDGLDAHFNAYKYQEFPVEPLEAHPAIPNDLNHYEVFFLVMDQVANIQSNMWGDTIWEHLDKVLFMTLEKLGYTKERVPRLIDKVAQHYLEHAIKSYDIVTDDSTVMNKLWDIQLVKTVKTDGSIEKCSVRFPEHYNWARVTVALQNHSKGCHSAAVGYPQGYMPSDGRWSYQITTGPQPSHFHYISAHSFPDLKDAMLAAKGKAEILVWHAVQLKNAKECNPGMEIVIALPRAVNPADFGIANTVDNLGILNPNEPGVSNTWNDHMELDQNIAVLSSAPSTRTNQQGLDEATLADILDTIEKFNNQPIISIKPNLEFAEEYEHQSYGDESNEDEQANVQTIQTSINPQLMDLIYDYKPYNEPVCKTCCQLKIRCSKQIPCRLCIELGIEDLCEALQEPVKSVKRIRAGISERA